MYFTILTCILLDSGHLMRVGLDTRARLALWLMVQCGSVCYYVGDVFLEGAQNSWLAGRAGLWSGTVLWHVLKTLREACESSSVSSQVYGRFHVFLTCWFLPSNTVKFLTEIVICENRYGAQGSLIYPCTSFFPLKFSVLFFISLIVWIHTQVPTIIVVNKRYIWIYGSV